MARMFHLSCLGALDPGFDRRALAARIAALLGSDDRARKAMDASPDAPVAIAIPAPTLVAARALDRALLKLGIVSLVCYVDPSLADATRVYVDQRRGPRRSDAKSGLDAPSPASKAARPRPAGDKRAARGRRAVDKG